MKKAFLFLGVLSMTVLLAGCSKSVKVMETEGAEILVETDVLTEEQDNLLVETEIYDDGTVTLIEDNEGLEEDEVLVEDLVEEEE